MTGFYFMDMSETGAGVDGVIMDPLSEQPSRQYLSAAAHPGVWNSAMLPSAQHTLGQLGGAAQLQQQNPQSPASFRPTFVQSHCLHPQPQPQPQPATSEASIIKQLCAEVCTSD